MGKTKILNTTQIDDIVNQYANGVSMKRLAQQYQISEQRIRKILVTNNVKIRTTSELKRKYTFNEHYFDEINTKDKAY